MFKTLLCRWLPVLVLLLVYVFVPVAEAMTCHDCSTLMPADGFDHEDQCSLCSGASAVFSYDLSTCYASTSSGADNRYISYSAPSFPINKPPQN